MPSVECRSSKQYIVSPQYAGLRLDHFLVHQFSDISRAALGRLILSGCILVNEQQVKTGYRLHESDVVAVTFPEKVPTTLIPQQIAFSILFEDEELMVIDKPAGLVVHPGDGHRQGTLANGLLYYCHSLPGLNTDRPGIVHRLDKDTSGILLVAKTDRSLRSLGRSFKNRQIQKTYHALLLRHPGQERGRLVASIGRHPVKRKKMAIRQGDSGRYAATNWSVLQQWSRSSLCLVEIELETGRTHQIRVHMASLGAPVAGDQLYGGRVREDFGFPIERQLLHASTLSFCHPVTGATMQYTAPLPNDLKKVIAHLNENDNIL